MNQFFDFSSRQLKFLAILSGSILIMAGYLFVKSFSVPTSASPGFNVYIGEPERALTGIFVLDPNTAPADSLELLPGVGKVLADRIIEYRQHHRFEKEVDITEVSGIGAKKFEKLKPYLKINKWTTKAIEY
ncbi:MAG: helix-hairpin-helix domain-containing protein [candidate division Zixibacteria bacterium]|nr:helix-hairpin-helix domain-containing protein [candidate division Zixibacteria bacterium]